MAVSQTQMPRRDLNLVRDFAAASRETEELRIARTVDAFETSRSSTRVETLRRERRRLRVLARCLITTEVAIGARIVVSGLSVATVTVGATLALLLLICVHASLALSAGMASVDAPIRARRGASTDRGDQQTAVLRHKSHTPESGRSRRARRS
jgi:hypothetical protein